jgi:hypothetical protein
VKRPTVFQLMMQAISLYAEKCDRAIVDVNVIRMSCADMSSLLSDKAILFGLHYDQRGRLFWSTPMVKNGTVELIPSRLPLRKRFELTR